MAASLADSTSNGEPSSVESRKELVDPFYAFHLNKGTFYSAKEGAFERAKADIIRECYNSALDGENIVGAWLLLEVDHWDNETEKMVLLTDESLYTVRYDFIPMKVYKAKKTYMKDIDTVMTGPFSYPKVSLCNLTSDLERRKCDGVRVMWNKGVDPSLLQKWNPSSSSMPWLTFTSHPLYNFASSTSYYNVKDFLDKLTLAINDSYKRHNLDQVLAVKQEALEQKIYIGLSSMVHNQSYLGMSKERGGLSF